MIWQLVFCLFSAEAVIELPLVESYKSTLIDNNQTHYGLAVQIGTPLQSFSLLLSTSTPVSIT